MGKLSAYFSITYYIRPSPKSQYTENLFKGKCFFFRQRIFLDDSVQLQDKSEFTALANISKNLCQDIHKKQAVHHA